MTVSASQNYGRMAVARSTNNHVDPWRFFETTLIVIDGLDFKPRGSGFGVLLWSKDAEHFDGVFLTILGDQPPRRVGCNCVSVDRPLFNGLAHG